MRDGAPVEGAVVSGLPGGTVTLLFTDIEGSTRMLHELGGRYGDLLAEHRRVLREAFRAHGGQEVDTQGDALFYAFASASDAVASAATAQRRLGAHPWPGGVELRVRMGIHTGEPTLTQEGYVGIDLHRGARICAAGHGGQVLVSETTRQLLREQEPEGVQLRDLGPHRLKDLTSPQHLYEIVGDGLLANFPPLKSLENRPTNLPVQPTPLLGRARDLTDLTAWLVKDSTRLVTLTGPGGTGKTRLGLQAAADALEDFPGGVFLVALSPINEPTLVVPTIAQTLGVREGPGRSLEQALVAFFLGRKALLVLDNFEQVIPAAPAVADLLAACPELRVLVTSRAPLRLPGEQEYPVGPLRVPDVGSLPTATPERLSQYEAVRLFVDRAQAVKPSFEVTNHNAPAVAEICVRLDGLPLAIELAAARIKVLSPQALLERLDQRLRLLTGGARGLPARQQTLRGAIDWSYDLLTDVEQVLFARLGVFVDGFSFEATERVCDVGQDSDVLDILTSLVDNSLVRMSDGDNGEPRFTMLETLREYATEHLTTDPQHDQIRDAHADYFSDLATQAASRLQRMESREWSDRLEEEHGNLRAALAWLSERERHEQALNLVNGAWRLWIKHGRLREGQALIERVLDESVDSPSSRRADVMTSLGELYRSRGDFERARRVKEDALPSLRRDSPLKAAVTLSDLGSIAEDQGLLDEARRLYEDALELQRERGEKGLIAHAMAGPGRLALRTGDLHRARSLYEHVLQAGRQLGDHEFINEALLGLAQVSRKEGDEDSAEHLCRESVALAARMSDLSFVSDGLAVLAYLAADRGEASRATRLLGAVDAICSSTGLVLYFPDEREQHLLALEEVLGSGEFALEFAQGQAMTSETATAFGLGLLDADGRAPDQPS